MRGQVAGGPQEHGGVTVMAAGMHGARGLGGMGTPACLVDGQCVHVGPEVDRSVSRGGPADCSDHPGRPEIFRNLDAQLRSVSATILEV